MKYKIFVADYGCGNTKSLYNSLKFLGFNPVISNNNKDLNVSTHIILPGVGSYANAIKKINDKLDLNFLKKQVFIEKKPFLGICVGMQVLSDYGFEFKKTKGLGWIHGEVKQMNPRPNILPQIGWNNLEILQEKNNLLLNISDKDYFYFVHSYAFKVKNSNIVVAKTSYNSNFNSIIQKENIIGVQFHPEKSQSSGLKLLKNFVINFK